VQHAKGRIIAPIFHRDGVPIKDFLNGWHPACRKAGIPGRRPHDFRRTAVRRYETANVSCSVAMKLTGHRTEAVYRRYAIVASADLAAGMAKVAALSMSSDPAPARVVAMDAARRPPRARPSTAQVWTPSSSGAYGDCELNA
jgi:hypothetical protein